MVAVELAPLARLTGSRGLTPLDGITALGMLVLAFSGLATRCSIACAWSRY
ncbi:monovalent cation/H+ antiporter subunit A [Pseudomonas aeruginosa]|nr:monovalent cation/H+ antiporter subunit A [Pseudomonas aeruginosa]